MISTVVNKNSISFFALKIFFGTSTDSQLLGIGAMFEFPPN